MVNAAPVDLPEIACREPSIDEDSHKEGVIFSLLFELCRFTDN